MIRIAAVGDLHFGLDSDGEMLGRLEELTDRADLLLLAGDLTKSGAPQEAAAAARVLGKVGIPSVAVLGNHDYHSDASRDVAAHLESAGVRVLEGNHEVVEIDGTRVGIAGTKGFGGGFAGACATDFGEPEMKEFVRHTKRLADRLAENLATMQADVRIALMHYSPIRGTLHGERLEIYPFLGSYLLAEAVDHGGADLVVHGHAHAGTEKGVTPGGIRVRNVAQHVIKHPYALYLVEPVAAAVG
jgi:Icc-related predicted phosphoesterase